MIVQMKRWFRAGNCERYSGADVHMQWFCTGGAGVKR